ncbi:hypothetical protein AB0368_31695 [Actinoplanes sp. NPDC051475]|uniref:hypothetical protein n=1 Tax=Actinoplanes sp. NPDC051475 TaxID=3157225 RepID=UPI00344D158E
MRFFSNDARESTDDPAPDDRPERVQSEPVAVPGQRPPSPWSDAPGEEARDTADRDRSAQDVDDDPDRTQFHEPGRQPTAFGASTVGGAVAASAVANPDNDRWDTNDPDTDGASGVADDRSVAPGDGAVESPSQSNTTTYAGTASQEERAEDSVEDPVDVALDDRGSFEDPQVKDADDRPATPTFKDEGGSGETLEAAPEEAPAPVAAAPAAAAPAASQPDTLFAAADAQTLQDRWRDVQLRFVDSPKEATTEAAALVEEAVEKLTAGLRSRKEGLGADSDDTETLRVQLRGYRDILNRILGL